MRILPLFLLLALLLNGDDFEEGFKAFAVDDYKTAFKHFSKGAEKNDKRSLYYLGYLNFYQEQNQELGMEQIKRAANMGYPEACFLLGTLFYKTGKFKTAMMWLKKGARLNHPKSIYLIGYMYEIGAGVRKSSARANYWYKKIGIN